MTTRETFIFWDMDGVVADFVGGSLAVHGKHIPPAKVGWDFMTQVGFTAGDPVFWEPLSNVAFWSGLAPLEDGLSLIRSVESEISSERMGILSSGLCPGSCDGKRAWLRQHLAHYEKRAVFCTVKEMCAAPCKLLVDDHEVNIDKFIAAGGRGVLVPRPWNRRSGETDGRGRFNVSRLMDEILDRAGV